MPKPAGIKDAKCDLEQAKTIQRQIFAMRGLRVMLDSDLAQLYGVTTKRLNEQLRRNRKRFPKDFAFQLTMYEAKQLMVLRSQNATLKQGQHIKYAPHVFTEHGAIMLASVLNSKTAIQASIYVVRAFVEMRSAMLGYADLSRRIDELAASYDHHFQQVFVAIRGLMATPVKSRRLIGFIGSGKARTRKKR